MNASLRSTGKYGGTATCLAFLRAVELARSPNSVPSNRLRQVVALALLERQARGPRDTSGPGRPRRRPAS